MHDRRRTPNHSNGSPELLKPVFKVMRQFRLLKEIECWFFKIAVNFKENISFFPTFERWNFSLKTSIILRIYRALDPVSKRQVIDLFWSFYLYFGYKILTLSSVTKCIQVMIQLGENVPGLGILSRDNMWNMALFHCLIHKEII